MKKTGVVEYLVLGVVFMFLAVLFYKDTLFYPPSYIHAWSQADRYAIALKYAEHGMRFWLPQTYNLACKEGVTGVDLPIHEYIIGGIMWISGCKSPFIFRLYMFFVAMVGYGHGYALARRLGASSWWAGVAILFIWLVPIVAYYQAGFIPSVSALAFWLCGMYYWVGYQHDKGIWQWILGLGFVSVAALNRMPYVLLWGGMVLLQGVYWYRQGYAARREWVALGMAGVCIALGMGYKHYLNTHYGTLFLSEVLPPSSAQEGWQLAVHIARRWYSQFLTPSHWRLGVGMLATVLLLRRYKHLPIFDYVLLTAGSGLCYFVVMEQQFVDHEYYFLDSLYPPLFLGVLGLSALMPTDTRRHSFLYMIAALILGIATKQSLEVQQLKYTEQPNDLSEITRRHYQHADKLLDSMAIPRTATVLVLDAYSYNIPLTSMQRNGYTVLRTNFHYLDSTLNRLPYQYVTVLDELLPSEILFNYPRFAHTFERVGGNGRLSVFKRATPTLPHTTEALLGIESTLLYTSCSFDSAHTDAPFWQNTSPRQLRAPTDSCGVLAATQEFGTGITWTYTSHTPTFEHILFEGEVYSSDSLASLQLVCSIEQGDSVLYYRSYPFDFQHSKQWKTCSTLFPVPHQIPVGATLKCYLWNKNNHPFLIDNLRTIFY